MPSGASTPNVESGAQAKRRNGTQRNGPQKKKLVVTCDSDIEPDDLVPAYLDAKAKLFESEREHNLKKKPKLDPAQQQESDEEYKLAKLHAKIARIESDVLFDKFVAEQQWKARRIVLEREIAAKRQQKALEQAAESEAIEEAEEPPHDDVNEEAERIAAEILAQGEDDDSDGLADLFANLPTNEVDPTTGKTNTVVNGANGIKVTIRDFGKWTGVSPLRVLEEACRSRFVAS